MNNKIVMLFVASTLILILGAYLLGKNDNPKTQVLTSSYSTTDSAKPKVQAETTSADLGNLKVSDQKSNDFLIKNTGSKPLQLSNIKSSCGCTVGQIIIEGKESSEFGMHSQSNEIFEIAPQKTAIVRVTYRPFIMPVYGFVEREVSMTTNDPSNPNLIFKVTSNVK